tara:strand:- start:593 stop:772 length:180 start_codon:yes stop_codon:yes gene_type:complete
MNKLNDVQDFSFDKNDSNQENQKNNKSKSTLEKVLCNHCGRTSSNGLRCLGICVADNEY